MTGRGIEVYIDLPLKNPYKEYYNILHTKTFWYLANSITKCYKKIMTHHSRTPIKNINISSTPRYFGIWQKVLKRIIKSINPSLKTPHKEYYNFIHTKIFWYLANSVTIYNYTYWSVPQDPPKKNITISHFVLGKWYYKLFLNMLTPSTLLGGNSFA